MIARRSRNHRSLDIALAHSSPPRPAKNSRVYDAIREAILSGRLPPGAPIDKAALCAQFGMSRFPVTTALNRLAFERLVVIAPQHGSFVAKLDYGDLSECMMIRRALEGDIAGLAAQRRPKSLLDALDRNLRYQAAAVAADDRDGFYALDVDFHEALTQGLGLVQARATLQGLRGHLERVRRLLTAPPGRLAATYAEHAAVGQAIAAGKRDGARAAMRHHLGQTAAVFDRFASAQSALFSDRT